MDDLRGALAKLKAQMAEAEIADMSSVKVGDIIYVPLEKRCQGNAGGDVKSKKSTA